MHPSKTSKVWFFFQLIARVWFEVWGEICWCVRSTRCFCLTFSSFTSLAFPLSGLLEGLQLCPGCRAEVLTGRHMTFAQTLSLRTLSAASESLKLCFVVNWGEKRAGAKRVPVCSTSPCPKALHTPKPNLTPAASPSPAVCLVYWAGRF